MSDDSSYSNSGPKRTTEERAGRPIENNYEAIRRIRKLDPMFDEPLLCRKLSWFIFNLPGQKKIGILCGTSESL